MFPGIVTYIFHNRILDPDSGLLWTDLNAILREGSMHLNIQSLSAKFDELKLLLAKLAGKGIDLDVIMVC